MDAFLRKHFAFSTTDANGTIIDVSDAFCRCSGYTKEELIGKNHNIVRHEDMSDAFFAQMWECISSGKSWVGNIKNRNKDGSFCWGRSYIEPIFGAQGEIIGYMAAKFDITSELMYKSEHEKNSMLHKQLLTHSRDLAMNEMVSLIAHQWRQPLSSISLALSNLEIKDAMGVLNKEAFLDTLHKAKDIVAHLSETIDIFGGYFKKKEGVKVSASLMIQKIKSILLAILESKDIAFEVVFEDDFMLQAELDHVFLNIYQNGLEALMSAEQKDKKIKTVFTKEAQKAVVYIQDNAGGIKAETIEKIFDPYFSTKSKNASGLGLYMSKNLVEETGGELSVTNRDGGACFKIVLAYEQNQENKGEK